MGEAWIIDADRTPRGRGKAGVGALSGEHPQELLDNAENYIKHDALVFRDIDFIGVWFLLMTKNYEKLADLFVDMRDTPMPREQLIALMKKRTQAIDCTRPEVLAAVPA